MSTPKTPREAALAAAEARLNPPPQTSDAAAQAAPASASASPSGTRPLFAPAPRHTEKEERDLTIKFNRLLDRGIIRDNSYQDAAEAVETLIKISTNILNSDDPKFRQIKASNGMLQKKVLAVKGGHDYLIALGFRTQTADFTKTYMFQKSLRSVHELEIGTRILQDHLSTLQSRVSASAQSRLSHAQAEAARRAAALAEIEADRDSVRLRALREKVGREAREREAREKEEALKDAEGAGMGMGEGEGEGEVDAQGTARREGVVSIEQDEDEDEDEDSEEEDHVGYAAASGVNESYWGDGRRLGD
ncbi:hypothetical protein L198_07343 [Cryptococcus wingfieldii CBS 7118]|uniref:PUB domain-containing protein n=1 Tax=Cryptococcus wingfieldii CBS 7118 TaxID=1295528 RepID=A0A1E3ICL9_9TREE|nr:hypothetical protein L198_07343 [Cryptococcus wingfieldii CBS 7118]ODN86324.1 hypothetical protein L198_07343 [Cryptococcus wingfieldii CBS 7118]